MCTNLFFCVGAVNTFWLVIMLSLHERSPHYVFPAPTKCIIKNKHLSASQIISFPLIYTTRKKEQSVRMFNRRSVVQQLVHRWMSVALINIRPRTIDCSLLWFDVCDGWAASSCEGAVPGSTPQTSAGVEATQGNRKEWGNRGHLPTGKAKGGRIDELVVWRVWRYSSWRKKIFATKCGL